MKYPTKSCKLCKMSNKKRKDCQYTIKGTTWLKYPIKKIEEKKCKVCKMSNEKSNVFKYPIKGAMCV